MERHYKLTNERNCTREGHPNCLQWGAGITHEASGSGKVLCTDGWIHCYADPFVGVMRDCHGGRYGLGAHMWECLGEGKHLSDGLKWGFRRITTLRELPLPKVTAEQRVRWGILCSLEVYKEQRYVQWAQRWLRGTGRKATTIQKIIYAAYYDTHGSPAAAMAAYHAAMAAYSIAKCAVVPLITTMSNASKAAGHAANAAEVDGPVIDFAALAHRAIANEQPSA